MSMGGMPYSPRGRIIDHLRGNPGTVIQRGAQLQTLADAMGNSADVMDRLVNNGSDMEGQAIDKLRELSEEVYAELRRASGLYAAVAPHITSYGSVLETSQPAITTLVEDLYTLWLAAQQAQSDYEAVQYSTPDYPRGDDADDPDLRQDAEDAHEEILGDASTAAANARQSWDDKAVEYDGAWDTWYDAFSTAATGIREDTSNAIEDSWDDDFGGFLATVSQILAIAGLVLAVLAIIVGGPIIAALALIVAVTALIVTSIQFARGEADGWDLAFAIVGVIPFGALGKFTGAARAPGLAGFLGESASFTDDFARWTGAGVSSFDDWANGLNALRGMSFVDGFADVSAQLLSGRGLDDWATAGQVGNAGINALDTMATVWGSQAQLAGTVKDVVGAIPDVFDWDHRLWS